MQVGVDITSEQRITTLQAALRILDKWQCSDSEKATLLGLQHDREDREEVSDSTLERISHILNIHKALRKTFSSDETIYNWVRKANNHPTLSGASAMDYMLSGNERALSKIAKLIIGYSAQ
jgi:hypothetical protein